MSERIKHKASDPTSGSVSGEGGMTGGKPGKDPKANSQGIPALAGDSKSSEAALVDGIYYPSSYFDELFESCSVQM